MITNSSILRALEEFAPKFYAEDFDNVGLLIGSESDISNGIICCLDVTEELIDQALRLNCNTIVSYHPLIFNSTKKIIKNDRVGALIHRIIKNDISLFCLHTNWDNQFGGVSRFIAEDLGFDNFVSTLVPKPDSLYQLTVYTPNSYVEIVKTALFNSGAGSIGNYKNCSFSIKGRGTFVPNENSNPFIGKPNEQQNIEEVALQVIVPAHLVNQVINEMKLFHPYETVAYELIALKNENQYLGMGVIVELNPQISEINLLKMLYDKFNNQCIKHSQFINKPLQTLAIANGSGAFAIERAISLGVDVLITSDLKYHDYFLASGKLLLIDIGHYESEAKTKYYLAKYLSQKFPNFAILESEISSNPVKYYTCHQNLQLKK